MEWQILLENVVNLAQQASDAVLEIYNSTETTKVQMKKDRSPLTAADLQSNRIICEGLQKLKPNWPIISEENKEIPYEERKHYEYYWLVDPVDGTKEFIKRNGQFTVNIALCHGNSPVLGVIVAPVLRETYYALKGSGAWKKTKNQEGRMQTTQSQERIVVVASASHMDSDTSKWISDLSTVESSVEVECIQIGSSLKFMKVADGSAQYYPRFHPCMEWDTAAAHIILKEAGGSIEKIGDEGDTLVYNKMSLLSPYFIAKCF